MEKIIALDFTNQSEKSTRTPPALMRSHSIEFEPVRSFMIHVVDRSFLLVEQANYVNNRVLSGTGITGSCGFLDTVFF